MKKMCIFDDLIGGNGSISEGYNAINKDFGSFLAVC